MVAKLDALWQSDRYRELVEARVMAPVRKRVAADARRARRKAAATRGRSTTASSPPSPSANLEAT
jgi:alpha-D-ribose 1-methylphosphonate 5-triphosphate synthase subunit PhnG